MAKKTDIKSEIDAGCRPDRLARLMRSLVVGQVAAADIADAGFRVCQVSHGYEFCLGAASGPVVLAAELSWTGAAQRLGDAAAIAVPIQRDDPAVAMLSACLGELAQPRCGGAIVVANCVQMLIVRALRGAIETGMAATGMMAGLADLSLCRALVAIHDTPAEPWTLESLAALAGMSRSSFAARFAEVVGVTPMRYLRDWRIAEARVALAEGERVGLVARRLGYASADAFSRAYARAEGRLPRADRNAR